MLQKQSAPINFAQGLDTKTDPFQVQPGKFLSLQNSVFINGGQLQKRNGFQQLSSLTTDVAGYLTTFAGNLTAIGNNVTAYNQASETWVTKGSVAPLQLSTLPMVRNSANQTQCDSAISTNGLVCVAYTENNGAATSYKYAILNQANGQPIVNPTLIVPSSGVVSGSPRVFFFANRFVIVFTALISGTSHLQFISISSANISVTTAAADIAASYVASTGLSWDGVVANNQLYVAYNTTSGGQAIKYTYLNASLVVETPGTFSGAIATQMSLCADLTQTVPVIYATYYNSANGHLSTGAFDVNLANPAAFSSPVLITSAYTVANIATAAQNGLCSIFIEVSNNYGWSGATIATDYVEHLTITSAGSHTDIGVSCRSIGLASKAFILSGIVYYLGAYSSTYQPTYFLMNGTMSTAASPVIVSKLAYENGGGYLTLGLPSVSVSGSNAYAAYLFKDLITALTTQGNSTQTTTGGIYSQTGINLVDFNLTTSGIDTVEIGNDLHISGGFLWMFDGNVPVEHNFFLWPDTIQAATSASGGSLTAQQYYYQVIYTWSDNKGNIFKSAPSIPVTVTTTGSTSSVTLSIPTLRLTYKTASPVVIEVFRWSAGQQEYFQVSSSNTQVNPILAPLLNSTTLDYVTFVDTWADSSILGNSLIYTTGGVIEDMNAPATNIMATFDTRLWLVDAEDQNLLWYSKQVIEATPVEMSDLFTVYIAPNTGTASTTGPITALAPMDDKLIIFKRDAIYYINGTGPDNTGANSQFSQPVFVTSTVGCTNQQSVVLMPNGLMFQSDKGIWLLGRDMSTSYIGASVEEFNQSIVESAFAIPNTNQVRFTLNTGQMLMYDYYYQQWGTFVGVPSVSACVFQNLHTFINSYGQIYQENPGVYLDGSNPTLMSFTTSWYNLTGLQGYQRAFFFYLLGVYYSPHKIMLQIAYDYNSSPTQSTLITPTNFSPAYGVVAPYEQQSPYGGPGSVEQWRVFLEQQRCQAFQIIFNEVFDSSVDVSAGAGLTLSGLNLIYGSKSRFTTIAAQNSAG